VRIIRTPRVINADKDAAYPPAIVQLKDEGVLEENCQHRSGMLAENAYAFSFSPIKKNLL